jgi:hypothetical protein
LALMNKLKSTVAVVVRLIQLKEKISVKWNEILFTYYDVDKNLESNDGDSMWYQKSIYSLLLMRINHRWKTLFQLNMEFDDNQMLHNSAFPKDYDDDNRNLLLNTNDWLHWYYNLNNNNNNKIKKEFLYLSVVNLRIGWDNELAVLSFSVIII